MSPPRSSPVTQRARRPKAPYRVVEETLPSGLAVRVIPNPTVPVVSLYTFFRVGARNERPGITGISHLFEHMMFNGAGKYGPTEFDRVLESHGGRSNAYTTHDLTVYHEDFPPEALDKVLDLESDRMRSLAISDKTLEAERGVVMEERRVSVDNDMVGRMDEELCSLVYKAHPYRWPVIGWMTDIERISRADCEAYFRTYYAPNNATLYLCGDVDPDAALANIRRYYGRMRRGREIPEVPTGEPEQRGERRAIVRHPAQAPALMVAYRAPTAREADSVVLDVLQFVLSVGENSRLTRELVYGRELAVSVHLDWGWRMDEGMLVLFLELPPGADARRAEEALYEMVDKVGKEGVTDHELQKAKNNLRANLMRELTSNSGRAEAIGTYEMLLGSWREARRMAERYEAVDAEAVQQAALRYFHPDRRSVVTLIPEEAS